MIYCCYLKIVSNTVFVKVHMLQYFVILNITCYKAVRRIQKNEIPLSHLNQYLKIAFMQSSVICIIQSVF